MGTVGFGGYGTNEQGAGITTEIPIIGEAILMRINFELLQTHQRYWAWMKAD